MATLHSQNFDTLSTGDIAPNWSVAGGDSWQVGTTGVVSPSNAYAGNPSNGTRTVYTGGSAIADMAVQISTTVQFSGGNSCAVSPMVRSDAGGDSYYRLITNWSASQAYFFRVNDGIGGAFTIPTYADGDKVNIKLEIEGSTLRARYWKSGEAEPNTWQGTQTDTTITSTGYGGATAFYNGYGTPSFDNFYLGTPGTTFGVPTQTVSANDTGLYYSPYNWVVSGVRAITNNPGAYIKIPFTGSQLVLNLSQGSATSRIRYKIDSNPWTDVALTQGTTRLTLGENLPEGNKIAEVHYLASGAGGADRWGSSGVLPTEALSITSLEIDEDADIGTYTPKAKRLVVWGDSRTEGYAGVSASPVVSDAQGNWAPAVADAFDAEYGIIGFGGQGFNSPGVYNVPRLLDAYDKYYFGVSRLAGGVLFPAPDYILLAHGVNGSGPTAWTPTMAQTMIANLRTIGGANAKLFVLVPFGQESASDIATAYNNYITATSDENAYLIDCGASVAQGLNQSGTPSFSATDGLHQRITYAPVLAGATIQAMQQAIGGTGGGAYPTVEAIVAALRVELTPELTRITTALPNAAPNTNSGLPIKSGIATAADNAAAVVATDEIQNIAAATGTVTGGTRSTSGTTTTDQLKRPDGKTFEKVTTPTAINVTVTED